MPNRTDFAHIRGGISVVDARYTSLQVPRTSEEGPRCPPPLKQPEVNPSLGISTPSDNEKKQVLLFFGNFALISAFFGDFLRPRGFPGARCNLRWWHTSSFTPLQESGPAVLRGKWHSERGLPAGRPLSGVHSVTGSPIQGFSPAGLWETLWGTSSETPKPLRTSRACCPYSCCPLSGPLTVTCVAVQYRATALSRLFPGFCSFFFF